MMRCALSTPRRMRQEFGWPVTAHVSCKHAALLARRRDGHAGLCWCVMQMLWVLNAKRGASREIHRARPPSRACVRASERRPPPAHCVEKITPLQPRRLVEVGEKTAALGLPVRGGRHLVHLRVEALELPAVVRRRGVRRRHGRRMRRRVRGRSVVVVGDRALGHARNDNECRNDLRELHHDGRVVSCVDAIGMRRSVKR